MVFKDQEQSLDLLIVAGDGPSLMGRDWLMKIQLDWNELYSTNYCIFAPLQVLLEKYEAVFRDEQGTVQGMKAKIHANGQIQPKFFRSRPLREKVEAELEHLEKEGIIIIPSAVC